MFRCWSCGNDYPDVPYSSLAEAKMWEQETYNKAFKDGWQAAHESWESS